eukprot:TRINITY_DN2637_c0_g1_i1.p1 TRINITY_DN2637_c0_g1~~TRINITY_DN2637_c0_g1_i1.p1  ORF type:complete len:539 (+),score=177.16 TRINITY_DN2637_c0_g1_i1:53-1669(+)
MMSSTTVDPKADRFFQDYIYKGVVAIWSNDETTAKEQLQDYKDQFPRDALEYSNIQQNLTWITNSKVDMKLTMDQVKKAEDLAEDFLKNPAKIDKMIMVLKRKESVTAEEKLDYTFDVRLVVAEGLMSRALMQFGLGNYVKGAYNLRKSWKKFEKLFKEIENSKDHQYPLDLVDIAKHSVAVFYFLVSFTPGTLLKVLELIGFVADREKGMTYLQSTVDHNGIKAPLASLFLSFNYLVLPRGFSKKEENLEGARKIIDTINQRYKTGSFPLMMSGVYNMKSGNLEEATNYFRQTIEAAKVITPKPATMHGINLGFCLVALGRVEEASKAFEELVHVADEFDGKAMSALALAACYKNLGRDAEAGELMNKIPGFLGKSGRLDAIATQRYETYKKRGLEIALYELLYFRRDLHHLKAKDLEPMWRDLKKHQPELESNVETKAIFNLVSGTILRGLGDQKMADQQFQAVVQDAKIIKKEIWTIPNAHYEIAEGLYWQGDLENSKSHLKSAQKYKDYEMAELTSNRVNMGLEQLVKDQKAKK